MALILISLMCTTLLGFYWVIRVDPLKWEFPAVKLAPLCVVTILSLIALIRTSDGGMRRMRWVLSMIRTNGYGRRHLLEERRKSRHVADSVKTMTPAGKRFALVLGIGFLTLAGWSFGALPECLVSKQFPSPVNWSCSSPAPHGMTVDAYRSLVARERQSVLWLLGGILAVFTLLLTFRRDEVVRSDYRLSLKNHELERDTNTTNRYSSALEQLGRKSEVEQIGAIFSLLRIARESPLDREAIAKLLASYIVGQEVDAEAHRFKSVEVFWEGRASLLTKRWEISAVSAPATTLAAIEALSLITDLVLPDSGGRGFETMHELNLEGAFLNGAFMHHADLGHTNLRNAQIEVADLRHIDLESANLSGASLRGSLLNSVSLDGDLRAVNFNYAQLEGAEFGQADLTGATFLNADLSRADLSGTVGLTSEQIECAACWDTDTKFPENLDVESSRTIIYEDHPNGFRKDLGY
ncbi:pentapeptide repeat-containing protein [Paeniglutamicibacter sp. ORCA_105]|uniref:pentapeptide repeat-containing protein n=1 Tax=Paeniglutamicibacter sp. ORCA_105 TaxID=3377336 RepID=UPI003895285B